MQSLIQFKRTMLLFLIPLALALFGFSSRVQAVSPAPDGCYPNFTTAEGCGALNSLTSGVGNTGLGWRSLFLNSTGSFNTGVGAGALVLNTADNNTATGAGSLLLNTTGLANTATGAFTLFSNTTGNFNTASGFFALHDNTTGSGITGYGASALQHNSTGSFNTAVGGNALVNNTTGGNNTATGTNALFSNTAANDNTAIGASALAANTGSDNTALGSHALSSNTTGAANTAIGSGALSSNTTGSNTAVGFSALGMNTTGIGNTVLGFNAGGNTTIGSNNIYIGSQVFGAADENNTIRIGDPNVQTATSIAGILGATASGGTPVFVTTGGLLGTITSSKRFKEDVKPMDKTSEALFALTPVSFRYKKEIDPAQIPQLGLVAEEVEKVNPDLVVRDKEGKPYSVRYDQVNAMLLNEFLKEHKAFLEEHRTVEELKKQVAALTAGLQKVSAQIELNKPAAQTVENTD
jgi:hypothetical protein